MKGFGRRPLARGGARHGEAGVRKPPKEETAVISEPRLFAGRFDCGHEPNRLRDLRKLRGRQRPSSAVPERDVGVGVASARAVKLGEGERGAQFEAAGFLGLRDGDGFEEGLFGGGRVGWIAADQISPRAR